MNDTPRPQPTLSALFLIFTRISLTSFGGGLSGWLLREFVQQRNWMSEEDFLNGLAISQAIPGINVTNMAIWIGYKLRGNWGALVSFLGIVVPSAVVIVLIGVFFSSVSQFDVTHVVLVGAGAAAIGLSLSTGLITAWRVPRRVIPFTIMAATFLAIGVFHWPLVWTVLATGSVSIGLAYLKV